MRHGRAYIDAITRGKPILDVIDDIDHLAREHIRKFLPLMSKGLIQSFTRVNSDEQRFKNHTHAARRQKFVGALARKKGDLTSFTCPMHVGSIAVLRLALRLYLPLCFREQL